MDFLKEWNSLETRGRLVVALYGIVSLHFWTQRILRRGVSEVNAEANLAIFSKLIGTPTVDEEAQRLLDKRRRISFQELPMCGAMFWIFLYWHSSLYSSVAFWIQ